MKTLTTSLWFLVGILLLPSYVLAATNWRIRYGKWVPVSIVSYAKFSKDWLSYYISVAGWMLIALIIIRLV